MAKDLLNKNEKPSTFVYPKEFVRVVELGLTNIEPWVVIYGDELSERYQGLLRRYPRRHLIPFAKRIDNDDVACWEKDNANVVLLIHDYASSGYEQVGEFDDFWLWFKFAIDQMIYYE